MSLIIHLLWNKRMQNRELMPVNNIFIIRSPQRLTISGAEEGPPLMKVSLYLFI